MAYYVSDGILFITLIISLFLKVQIGHGADDNNSKEGKARKKKENRRELRKLFTPSALIFFGMIFQGGLMWGIKDNYFFVYVQDELGASSKFIGYVNTIAVISGIVILPPAKWIIAKIGEFQICYIGIILDVFRIAFVALVKYVFNA